MIVRVNETGNEKLARGELEYFRIRRECILGHLVWRFPEACDAAVADHECCIVKEVQGLEVNGVDSSTAEDHDRKHDKCDRM